MNPRSHDGAAPWPRPRSSRLPSAPSLLRLALLLPLALAGCGTGEAGDPNADNLSDVDPEFGALQLRGEEAMGVDQYASVHQFDALPDGGRIELQHGDGDPTAVATIRRHLQEIEAAFAEGDFSAPAFVHDEEVPGTAVMAARKDRIRYVYSPLPRGGEVRIQTTDPESLEAIRAFIAYQREDHRAGGTDHGTINHGTMDHGAMDHGAAGGSPPPA